MVLARRSGGAHQMSRSDIGDIGDVLSDHQTANTHTQSAPIKAHSGSVPPRRLRPCFVAFLTSVSFLALISGGVPQGSILGPVML